MLDIADPIFDVVRAVVPRINGVLRVLEIPNVAGPYAYVANTEPAAYLYVIGKWNVHFYICYVSM